MTQVYGYGEKDPQTKDERKLQQLTVGYCAANTLGKGQREVTNWYDSLAQWRSRPLSAR